MEASTIEYTKSKVKGMGSIAHASGVSFRLWAPNAHEVFVMGEFNEWQEDVTPLFLEKNGYWSVDVPEAQVGNQYKYVIKASNGNFVRNDPYARQLTNSVGNSIVHDHTFDWTSDNFQMPNFNEMVIYELHVGTFNSKEENKVGDFYGVIERLDFLKALGVNVIELMPIAEFPGGYSWGYNPAHPFAVEEEYGGPNGLKALVKAAHSKGIAVILDVVYNHFGPSDMDLWQFDGWHENGLGGIYFYNDWRAETPWGNTRPDYGRPEVRQYIRDNAMMWLEEYHIDGLRMDMIPYMRNVNADGNPDNDLQEGYSLIQWINAEIKEKFPHKFTVAEDLHSLHAITSPVEQGGLGYSSQWDAKFVHPIRQAIIAMNDEERDMNQVAASILHRYNDDAFQRVVYTESHDEVANGKARVVQEIASQENIDTWYAKKRSTLGAALMMTAPGIPMIFQGQTIMEDRWFDDTDPVDWERFTAYKGITKLYRDLIHLRLNRNETTRGLTGQHVEVLHLDNDQKIIAYKRWMDGGNRDTTIIIMNFSHQSVQDYTVNFPSDGIWKIRFNSDWKGYDTEFSNHFSDDTEAIASRSEGNYSAQISLGAYSAIIYSQD